MQGPDGAPCNPKYELVLSAQLSCRQYAPGRNRESGDEEAGSGYASLAGSGYASDSQDCCGQGNDSCQCKDSCQGGYASDSKDSCQGALHATSVWFGNNRMLLGCSSAVTTACSGPHIGSIRAVTTAAAGGVTTACKWPAHGVQQSGHNRCCSMCRRSL